MNSKYQSFQYSKDSWLGIILFFLCPMASIPFLIYGVYRNQYKNLVWISLILALIALITPLFADSYSHGLQYMEYSKTAPAEQFIYSNGVDFIFYTLSHFFAVNGIPFEFVKGIFTFICYQVSFFLFKKVLERNQYIYSSTVLKFNVFLIFLLSVPFIWIVNGIRMATAGYILALGWYYFYDKKIWLGVLCYIVAQSIHFSSMLFLPMMLYTIFRPFKISKKIFIACFVMFLFAGNNIQTMLPKELIYALNMESTVDIYINRSKENFTDTMSINGFIAMILERTPLILLLFYLLANKMFFSSIDKSIMYLGYLFIVLFFPFAILFQKYCLMFIPIALFLYLINEKGEKKCLKWLTVSCFVVSLAYLYGYREILLETPFYTLLLNPFIAIFSVDTIESMKNVIF